MSTLPGSRWWSLQGRPPRRVTGANPAPRRHRPEQLPVPSVRCAYAGQGPASPWTRSWVTGSHGELQDKVLPGTPAAGVSLLHSHTHTPLISPWTPWTMQSSPGERMQDAATLGAPSPHWPVHGTLPGLPGRGMDPGTRSRSGQSCRQAGDSGLSEAGPTEVCITLASPHLFVGMNRKVAQVSCPKVPERGWGG